jgi:hypothetical protein
MSPCIRIELEYADGARQVATGEAAVRICKWLDLCQAVASETSLVKYDGPQMQFIEANERTSHSDPSPASIQNLSILGDKPPLTTETTPTKTLRGDQESA